MGKERLASLSADTLHGEAMERIQADRFSAMSPTEKLEAALRLYHSARELKAAWVRSQNPLFNEAQVQRMVRESFLYART
jgi:hypothetical protein